MSRPRHLAGSAAVLALGLIGMACGSGSAGTTAGPVGADNTPTTQDPATLVSISPLDDLAGLGQGPMSRIAFANLVEPEIAACMSDAGWSYTAAVRDGDHAAPTDPAGAIEWAQTWGYGLLQPVPADANGTNKKARNANGDYVAGLDSDARGRYAQHLSGCQERATAAHASQFPFTNPTIAGQVVDAKAAVAADPRLGEAHAQWAACMAAAGLPADNPEAGRALFNDAVVKGSTEPADVEREKHVATIDATCASTTLWPVQAALEQVEADRIVAGSGSVQIATTS